MSLPRSLMSIVPMLPSGIGESEIHLPIFDYFDSKMRSSQPPKKQMDLPSSAEVLANDLVNAAVYSHLVQTARARAYEGHQGLSLLVALTLIEGFLVSFPKGTSAEYTPSCCRFWSLTWTGSGDYARSGTA
jgi:hypothetical protein